MQEDLLGYLLDALDPAEREQVEARVASSPALQEDLRRLRVLLDVLECDREPFGPPPGLAERTCKYVAKRVTIYNESPQPVLPFRWHVADALVAAGIFLAASMLFFPALAQSRFRARLTACQNNLLVIGQALACYSQRYDGYFPVIPLAGNLGVAGIYGPTLLETGFLDSPRWLLCPGCDPGLRPLRVPTLAELRRASPEVAVKLHRQIGGSYAYALGYIEDGRYCYVRNEGRPWVPILADAPRNSLGCTSSNHGCGQNVLFDDLHVCYLYLANCEDDRGDHIYLNRLGVVAAGIGWDDAVLGRSDTRPIAALQGAVTLPKAGLQVQPATLPGVPGRDMRQPRDKLRATIR